MLPQFAYVALASLAIAKPLTIDLETNWAQSPYKAQFVESLSSYNASAYFPMLSLLLAEEDHAARLLTDAEVHQSGLAKSLKSRFITPEQVSLLEADLALGTFTPRIEAKYRDFLEEHADLVDCENVLFYNDKATCDSGAVFALETDAVSTAEIYETDHIIGGNQAAPWAILYADLSTASFPVFHAHLLSSAIEGKINYVLRYKPTPNAPVQRIGGYGVTVQVKRTDYLVVDDRNSKSDLKLDMDAPNKLTKQDLPKLSHRLTTAILKHTDRFAGLVEYVLNLPSHLTEINQFKPSAKVKEDEEENGRSFFTPGTNALMVNGAPASPNSDYNVFQLMDVMREELASVEALEALGLDSQTARELICSGVVEVDPELTLEDAAGADDVEEKRYDYRSDAVVWINDIEKMGMYEQLSPSLEGLFDPEVQLAPIRRNVHNLVITADMNNLSDLQLVAQLFQLVSRRAPVRVGVVPLGSSLATKNLIEVAQLGSFFARQKYIIHLIESKSPELALEQAQLYTQDGKLDPRDESIGAAIDQFVKDFDIDRTLFFVNGHLVIPGQEWVYDAMAVLATDDARLKAGVSNGLLDITDTTTDLEELLLGENPSTTRNPLIDPTDPSKVNYIATSNLHAASYGYFSEWLAKQPANDTQSVWVVGDLTGALGAQQLINLLPLAEKNITLRALPVVDSSRVKDPAYRKSLNMLFGQDELPAVIARIALEGYREHTFNDGPKPKFLNNVTEVLSEDQFTHLARVFRTNPISNFFPDGQVSVVIDGRLIPLRDEALDVQTISALLKRERSRVERINRFIKSVPAGDLALRDQAVSLATSLWFKAAVPRVVSRTWAGQSRTASAGNDTAKLEVTAIVDPVSETAQSIVSLLKFVEGLGIAKIKVFFSPHDISTKGELKIPNRYFQGVYPVAPEFKHSQVVAPSATFEDLNDDTLYVVGIEEPAPWVVMTRRCDYDLDNVILNTVEESSLFATYELRSLLIEGAVSDLQRQPSRGTQLKLTTPHGKSLTDTMVMANLGYYQLQANPGHWQIRLEGPSESIFDLVYRGAKVDVVPIVVDSLQGSAATFAAVRKPGMESVDPAQVQKQSSGGWLGKIRGIFDAKQQQADINVFTVASGHLYERFLSIMSLSVMNHTEHSVKFWLIENFLSPSFKEFLPELAREYKFDYEFITYKWPHWLRAQSEKQREIWGYKILFLDVLFPQSLDKVMFVDSDQIVRTDLQELVDVDLQGAPYGYAPMGDDREETEGFRFWKQGYWKDFLKGRPYHISALYVVDLERFREMSAGDILRQHYQQLSADPASLANLDQDLPNNLQQVVPIFSLDQDWLWCETWCSDEGLRTAKTIDLCNNPLTKEPKLDRARRQIPEWTKYDDTVAELRAKFVQKRAEEPEPVAKNQPAAEEEEEEEEEHYEL